jgi:hypothetical protein
VARDREPVDRCSEQHVQASPNQTRNTPAKYIQEHRRQRPADRAGKAGDQGNPGDSAACIAAIEPGQGSKGRIVETHTDADAEHRPGNNEPCDAMRRSEDQQSGADDQVRGGQQMASTVAIDQPPDRWANHRRQQ